MNKVTILVPRKVENTLDGFNFFNDLFVKINTIYNCKIILDFKNTRWFEANLVAVLGAWLEHCWKNGNIVSFDKASNSIRTVFMKNGFYKYYSLGNVDDVYHSTIQYKIFNVNQQNEFTKYIIDEVIPKIRLDELTSVANSFISSLGEIFANVKIHSNSDKVISCGQYYYSHQKVCFTIVDIGNTIGLNVRNKFNNSFIKDCDAIDWATIEGNTTKVKGEFGGIGLHIIDEFLQKNGGTFQIISGFGYWEKTNNIISKFEMNNYFPGTIVNLQSNLVYTFEVDEFDFDILF